METVPASLDPRLPKCRSIQWNKSTARESPSQRKHVKAHAYHAGPCVWLGCSQPLRALRCGMTSQAWAFEPSLRAKMRARATNLLLPFPSRRLSH